MSEKLVQRPDLEKAQHLGLVIGLSCRNLRGFAFMWLNVFSFIGATRNAPGRTLILPGVSSPFSILLVSYWESEKAMMQFVRSPAHLRWMRFIYKHPRSLNLFNETYGRPQSANYINEPRGYAGSLLTPNQPGRPS
ncbi:MAG TPA: hypothetical protein VE954_22800 [Oligoflexus sp.]|uniref:hypothetical protein n=1 Tax=Oligoflexus sp. TaxID=1971216 RepID=UPI002D2F81AF|nr:hypothetical protein [Oligoflexus sp.]HYX35940.1 hypothetical protein [Oligoflexus sp.]